MYVYMSLVSMTNCLVCVCVCVCVCVRSPNRQVNKDLSNEPLVETEKDGSSSSKKYPFLHDDLNMTVHICPTENMMHQRAR